MTTGERGFEWVCVSPEAYTKGVRPFGGRDYREIRPCDPQKCPDYQKGACKLRGYVEVIIPGTRGAGVWHIGTSSIYSFLQMREQLEMVQRVTKRIQGLINETTGKPIFFLRKANDSISRVDVDKGEATRTEQDLIYLESDIDLYELITTYQPTAVIERGQRATAALTGKCETTPEKTTAAEKGAIETGIDAGAEGERREIVTRIFDLWGRGITLEQKKALKKDHPAAVEDMTIEQLKEFEQAIMKLQEGGKAA